MEALCLPLWHGVADGRAAALHDTYRKNALATRMFLGLCILWQNKADLQFQTLFPGLPMDITTLFFVEATLLFLFGVVMLVDSLGQDSQEGSYWFAASNFLGGIGLLLRFVFPHSSPWVLLVIPNLLLFLELSLLNKAIAEFVEHGRNLWIGFLALSFAVTAATAYIIFRHPAPTLIANLISLMTISTAGSSAFLLFRYVSPKIKLSMWIMGTLFALYGLNNLLRLGHDWVIPAERYYHVWFDRTILASLSVSYLLMTEAQLRHKLQHLANVDPLTGVLNRRAFENEAQRRVESDRRKGHCVSALMLDVDHFKQINDTYGHHAGDRALQELAEALRRTMRVTDIIVRLGGDEFLVILSGITAEQANEAAERLRQQLATLLIPSEKGAFRIQASVGVTSLDSSSIELDDLLKLGDRSLYAAKSGRAARLQDPALRAGA